MLALFLQAASMGLAAAASPGPSQAFLINQTLLGGWKRGAPVALSVFISDPPIVITILLLLNQLPENFMRTECCFPSLSHRGTGYRKE